MNTDNVGEVVNEVCNEYYSFLDVLRESGVTNMFGATPYIMEEFNLDKYKATNILLDWIQQYGKTK